MPKGPTVTDDGSAVTLDLHGRTVEEGLDLARSAVRVSAKRGRSTLKILHGSSSSNRLFRNRTIKHAIHEWLTSDSSMEPVASFLAGDGHTLVALRSSGPPDQTRISLRDLVP